ncbi:MAG: FG-GAP-like repeat-containing protein [Bacteroidota bacterium]|nr:FG-GAP-like repeat-containing protein [Bacteroidota bacterium]
MMRLLLLIALSFSFSQARSAIDTLRHFDPASLPVYYTSADYLAQIARFEPRGPGTLLAVNIYLDGPVGSSVRMHLLGHEGGVAFPQLEKDIIDPVKVTKTTAGFEIVTVHLPKLVFLDNDQFFILVDSFNNARLASDRKPKLQSCKSTDGGNFGYQYIKTRSGASQLYPHGWQSRSNAYMIEAVIDYSYEQSPLLLRDVTVEAGLDTNMSAHTVAWTDYNRDGFLDMFAAGSLYINTGTGTFTRTVTVPNVQANAFIDMNNDGLQDMLFLGAAEDGTRKSFLYIQNETDSFSRVDLDLPLFRGSLTSFSIADINTDGYPDLFIGQLWYAYPDAELNYLFINDNGQGFTDQSQMLYPGSPPARRSRGSSWVDYDNDGDQDLYVTNYYLEPDEFYRNNGDGTFTNIQSQKGIDQTATGSSHGTGCDWADYDADGDMDLLLPQFAHPWGILKYDHRGTTIYSNTGAPEWNFEDLKETHGIEYEETHAGAAWGDVNNDGLQDFIITTYYGCRYIDMYVQNEDHTFTLRSFEHGIADIVTGEDAVWADYDNDGRLDVIVGRGGTLRLFRNEAPGNANWVQFDLESTSGNVAAVGTKVIAYYGGKPHMQDVNAGRGQRMQRPARLHFGMAQNTLVDSVVISWPGAEHKKEVYRLLLPNIIYSITEGGIIDPPALVPKDEFTVYPNPADGQVHISYQLGAEKPVILEIINAAGQRVYLANYYGQNPGAYSITWSGEGTSMEHQGYGLYIIRMRIGDAITEEKVIFRSRK